MRGVVGGSAVCVVAMPWVRSVSTVSCGRRVATAPRALNSAGGLAAVAPETVTLAGTGFTSSAPRTGMSCRTSASAIRCGRS